MPFPSDGRAAVTSDVSISVSGDGEETERWRGKKGVEKEVASSRSTRLSGRREAPDGSGEEEQACKQAQLRRHQDHDRQADDHGHKRAKYDGYLVRRRVREFAPRLA